MCVYLGALVGAGGLSCADRFAWVYSKGRDVQQGPAYVGGSTSPGCRCIVEPAFHRCILSMLSMQS